MTAGWQHPYSQLSCNKVVASHCRPCRYPDEPCQAYAMPSPMDMEPRTTFQMVQIIMQKAACGRAFCCKLSLKELLCVVVALSIWLQALHQDQQYLHCRHASSMASFQFRGCTLHGKPAKDRMANAECQQFSPQRQRECDNAD